MIYRDTFGCGIETVGRGRGGVEIQWRGDFEAVVSMQVEGCEIFRCIRVRI
jgi:hypothetical protein